MKKIAINGRFLTQPTTGVQRYAIELVKAIDKLLNENLINNQKDSFVLFVPPGEKKELSLKYISISQIGHLNGHFWEQIELPRYLKGRLLLSLCNTGPLIVKNQIATIHDAAVFAVPSVYSFVFRNWYQTMMKKLAKGAKKIVTDSSFSKSSIMKYCNIMDSKIKVIYNGKEHIVSVEPDDTIMQKISNKPFVLAVSSITRNKNFHSIIKALELLNEKELQLVVVGSVNSKVFAKGMEFFNNNNIIYENIRFLGHINDKELKALYENALCLLYPSFYEGFGFPPLEAMACGCPVIASNAASLPEVCGSAVIYCNPYDPSDIAEKIKEVMANDSLRKELRQKGLLQAQNFNWEKCALEYIEVVKEASND